MLQPLDDANGALDSSTFDKTLAKSLKLRPKPQDEFCDFAYCFIIFVPLASSFDSLLRLMKNLTFKDGKQAKKGNLKNKATTCTLFLSVHKTQLNISYIQSMNRVSKCANNKCAIHSASIRACV